MSLSSSPNSGLFSPLDDLSAIVNGFLQPSPGLKSRLIVLAIFLGSLPLFSAMLFALHVVSTRRRKEKIYLWKMVQREEGRYIVGSRTILLCLTALIVFGTLGGTTYSAWRFVNDLTYGTLSLQICQFAFWMVFFAFTWSFTAANFQTWLLMNQRFRRPRLANALFVVPLIVGEAILIAICILGSVETERFFASQNELLNTLAADKNSIDLPKIFPLVTAYFSSSGAYFGLVRKLQITFACSLLPVLILNLAAVAVYSTLRQHRRDVELLSPALVLDGSSDGSRNSRGKALKGVEHIFLVDAIAVAVWSIAIMAHTAYAADRFPGLTTSPWPVIEAVFFLPGWLAAVPFSLALLTQIIIAWRNLPPPARTDAEAAKARPSFVLSASPAPPRPGEEASGGIEKDKMLDEKGERKMEVREVREVEMGGQGES